MNKLTKRIELLEATLENAKERQVMELRTIKEDLKTAQAVIMTVNYEEELYYEIIGLIEGRIEVIKNELKIQGRRVGE